MDNSLPDRLKFLLGLRQCKPASPSLQKSLEEAAKAEANKSKVELGQDAVMLRHLQEIARDDVEDVRKLKAKHLGGEWAASAQGDDVGDIIICDDYRRDSPRPPKSSSWLKLAALIGLSLLSGAGIGGGLLTFLGSKAPEVINKQSTEGFLLDLVPAEAKE